jgi:GNAT superfamily N-acetyltransferase
MMIDDALVLTLRAAPMVQFNHAIGLGMDGPARAAALDAVIERMKAAAGPVWALQVPPAALPAELPAWLAARGLAPAGEGWVKLWRPAADPPRTETDLDVREVGPSDAGDFATALLGGFGMPAPFAPWVAAIVGRPGWHAYVAYDGAQPVGGAALFVMGDLGWCGMGAVLASHRRRGGQGALLARRVADAGRLGCQAVVSETGQPAPGSEAEHPSYRNLRRAGFEPAYVRPNYRPVA